MRSTAQVTLNNHRLDENMIALWKGSSTLATVVTGPSGFIGLNQSLKTS